MTMNDQDFWMLIRQALLAFVDAIERRVNAELEDEGKQPKFQPRTAELRRLTKRNRS
jgi:hypothetical protein